MENEIILSDNDVVVLTPKKAASRGHIIVAPTAEIPILEAVPEPLLEKMFQIANKMSSVLFETIKCQGTNILIQNGTGAGQINNRFSINIIPRFENDNINFEWKPNQSTPDDLDKSLKKFSDYEKQQEEKKFIEQKKAKAEEPKVEEEIEEENYLAKSLIRRP